MFTILIILGIAILIWGICYLVMLIRSIIAFYPDKDTEEGEHFDDTINQQKGV